VGVKPLAGIRVILRPGWTGAANIAEGSGYGQLMKLFTSGMSISNSTSRKRYQRASNNSP
jgi:hypothetical protein